MIRRAIIRSVCLALVLSTPWWGISPAGAGDDNRSFQERKADRADALRERAQAKAAARLGYPPVYGPSADTGIDYRALSQQIARLAALIQSFAGSLSPTGGASSAVIPPPPGLADSGPARGWPAEVTAVYGPNGPTEASVRLLLEYRLMVAGNPRLKVGDVTEGQEAIIARVVTVDGSMVEEYTVDKKTGLWRPVR